MKKTFRNSKFCALVFYWSADVDFIRKRSTRPSVALYFSQMVKIHVLKMQKGRHYAGIYYFFVCLYLFPFGYFIVPPKFNSVFFGNVWFNIFFIASVMIISNVLSSHIVSRRKINESFGFVPDHYRSIISIHLFYRNYGSELRRFWFNICSWFNFCFSWYFFYIFSLMLFLIINP